MQSPKNTEFDRSNWLQAPVNRASFQAVQNLFPTARIKRGQGPISSFELKTMDILSQTYNDTRMGNQSFAAMLERTYTDAFLVAQDGLLICEEYFNGMQSDSQHLLNSVSKSFLGMLVGILVADGRVDPEAKVTTYLPELADTAFASATVQTALDMTAAVDYSEDYDSPSDDFWAETSVLGWVAWQHGGEVPASLHDYLLGRKQASHAELEQFHYRTVLTNLLAFIVQRVTGKSPAVVMQERLWQPLGPEQDAAVVVDGKGFPYFGAGMNTCARDLLRFGEMLRLDGYFNGQQIVPADWVRRTLAGNAELRELFAASDYAGLFANGHYHNQVWADASAETLMCIGIYGQTIYIDKAARLVVVKLSSHPQPANLSIFGATWSGLNALSQRLG